MLAALLLAQSVVGTPLQQPYPCPTLHPSTPLPADFQVHVPANDECEVFHLDGPNLGRTDPPAPLLVLFHGFAYPNMDAGTHNEYLAPIFGTSDLIERAVARGWFVMMHDGASVGWLPGFYATYGSDRFQRATRKAIKHVTANWKVDPDRIYGYGFSMGGHETLAWAARHLDPGGPMFAAAISHSGYLSSIYQWMEDTGGTGNGFPYADNYGYPGAPIPYCTDPFPWQRANVFDVNAQIFDKSTCTLLTWPPTLQSHLSSKDSQLHNISRMPVQLFTINGESPVVQQTNFLAWSWRNAQYPSTTTIWTPYACATLPSCPQSNPPPSCPPLHNWQTVCPDIALDFFDDGINPPKTLSARLADVNGNTNNTLLAEDGKRYFHFRAVRTAANDFGRLRWDVAAPATPAVGGNKMTLHALAVPINITTLTVEAENDGFNLLDPADTVNPLRVETPETIHLEITGYGSSPSQVLHEIPGQTPTVWNQWSYAGGVVSITGTSGTSIWHVVP